VNRFKSGVISKKQCEESKQASKPERKSALIYVKIDFPPLAELWPAKQNNITMGAHELLF